MLRLIKDFEAYQIIYYWLDEEGNKISPDLPTLTHARDWFIMHQKQNYTGKDRRRCAVDRRTLESRTTPYSRQRRNKEGRRATDRPITVDEDRSVAKIQELRQGLAS